MTRRKKEPLRELTEEEQNCLVRISRSQSEPAGHVARAKQILRSCKRITPHFNNLSQVQALIGRMVVLASSINALG